MSTMTIQHPSFVSGRFDGHSSEAKGRFASEFIRFVESGFKRSAFKKTFYCALSNSFGHITHCDIDGFYAEQFSSIGARCRFCENILQYPCYGSPEYTYSDVEGYLQDWVNRTGLLNRLQREAREELEKSERAELARLQAKYSTASGGFVSGANSSIAIGQSELALSQ